MTDSMITIKDGVGIINHEFATDDVDYSNLDMGNGGRVYREHRMRIDAGNGYKLSVVFGFGTYSDNHFSDYDGNVFKEEVSTAEIAVVREGEGLVHPFDDEWGDGVKGHCDAAEILYWLGRVRELEAV